MYLFFHVVLVGGGLASEADTNDYLFRDSFDHSSSESHLLIDGIGKSSNTDGTYRSVTTPVPRMQKLQNASKLCLQPVDGGRSIIGKSKARFVRLFVSAFVLTVTILFIIVVIVFETDSTVFENIRKTPEMMTFKSQYYIPIKEFLRTKLGLF